MKHATAAHRLDHRGLELASRNKHDEALHFFERALSLNRKLPAVHAHIGNSLVSLGRWADARRSYETALSLSPACAEAHNGLGVVDSREGNLEAAATHFRITLQHDPRLADAESNLGHTLAELGDLDGAVACFKRAIALQPQNPRHYRHLVLVRPAALEPSHLEALEHLCERSGKLARSQRIELHFALGKIYADAKRTEEAFFHYSAGNNEKRSETVYDEAREMEFVSALQATFTPVLLELLRGSGNPSKRPIFVFGMPRSGTTLVAQVLAALPDVVSAGELTLFGRFSREALPFINSTIPLHKLRAGVSELASRYLDAIDRIAADRPYVVDKTLQNFHLAPLINVALPNARMVHVRRNPLDTCVSCYMTLFADNMPFAYELGELGRYYRAYDELMEPWRRILPADRFLEVDYERVVDNFEPEMRRVIEFCNLEWQPACLEFYKAARPVRTASYVQVRQPLYRSSVGCAEPYREYLGPLLAELPVPRPEARLASETKTA